MEKIKLLIVDDEEIICNGLASIDLWQKFNCEVVGTAKNGKVALDLIRRQAVDLVLTDIKMPVMGGLELAKAISEISPSIIVVLLSGYKDFEYAREAIRHGVFAYLLKPYSISEIEELMISVRVEFEELQMHPASLNAAYQFKSILLQNGSEIEGTADWLYSGYLGVIVGYGHLSIESAPPENLFEFIEAIGRIESYGWISVPIYDDTLAVAVPDNTVDYERIKKIVNKSDRLRGFMYPEVLNNLTEWSRAWSESKIRRDWIEYGNDEKWTEYNSIPYFMPKSPSSFPSIALSIDNADSFRRSLESYLRKISGKPFISFRELRLSVSDMVLSRFELSTDALQVSSNFRESTCHCRNINELVDFLMSWYDYYENRKIGESEETVRISHVIRARSIIDSRYSENIGLNTVADEIGISPEHLSRLFRMSTGMNFKQYLLEKRMERSKELLSEGCHKIYEIAEMVGYQDERYFSRCFKLKTGYTPINYRNRFACG